MYKFPVSVPSNRKLSVSQKFHVRIPTDMSQALNTQTYDHLGVDVVCGTPEQTWGTDCVWPFPWPGVVWESIVDRPFGATKHAHSQINTTDPTTGINYALIYLHLSAVTETKAYDDPRIVTYNEGDVSGKIGNNGAVSPVPTPAQPYNGTHLHLGLCIQNPGDLNYAVVDPLLYLDANNPFVKTSVTPFTFQKNLWIGMKNADVLELQKRLGVIQTGFFGSLTFAAVRKYQTSKGIPSTGFVGVLTRAALNA